MKTPEQLAREAAIKITGSYCDATYNENFDIEVCFNARIILAAITEPRAEQQAEHAATVARLERELKDQRGINDLAEAECATGRARLAAAEADTKRLDWLARALEDVNIGDVDPTDYITETIDWPEAWRLAIDSAASKEGSL
jgi:hypothetical protein